jgi:hypothetical protein
MSLPHFGRHDHGNINRASDVEAMSLPGTEVRKRLWVILRLVLCLDCVASSDAIIDKLESYWKETVVARSRYCRDIFVKGLRKITNDLSQDGSCPGRNLVRRTVSRHLESSISVPVK